MIIEAAEPFKSNCPATGHPCERLCQTLCNIDQCEIAALRTRIAELEAENARLEVKNTRLLGMLNGRSGEP